MRLWVCLLALPVFAQPDGATLFESRIRPLLEAKCISCHSASSQPIMGGLRLDSRAELLRGGSRGPALVEGKPADSLLLKVVMHTAGPLKMPPGPKLKDAEIADLAQWVALGAPWGQAPLVSSQTKQKHWSLKPVSNPSLPAVKNQAWVQSPIDAFILAGLEAKGLSPAPTSDRRTLIRRLTYDLTGLPPTPAEVEAFLADKSTDAWPRLVDRLLASPRYGERWARHWLDVARYADSNGLDENLVYKNAFRYRDYVIAAFNKDKPYDQFIREQLAGDLLPPTGDLATELERWTATGFLSLGAKMLAEDDPVKMQMDIVDEQLDTTAKAFMGLTVGCARCHDHKFDPISAAEYYAMAGIFKSSHTMDHHKVVAKWHEYVLAPKADRDRLAAHEARIEAERKRITDLTSAENKKLSAAAMRRVGAYLRAARLYEQSSRIQLAAAEKESAGIVLTAPTKTTSAKPFLAEYTVQVERPGLYQLDLLNEEKGSGTADIYLNGEWQRQGLPPVQNRAASPESGGWSVALVLDLKAGSNTLRFEHASKLPKYDKLLLTPHTTPEYPLSIVQAARRFDVNPGYLSQWIDYFDRSQAAPASPLYAWEILDRGGDLSAWSSPAAKLFPTPLANADAIADRFEQLFITALDAGKDSTDPGLKTLYDFLFEKYGPYRAPENVRRYYSDAIRDQLKSLETAVADLEKQKPDLPRAMGVREAAKFEDIPIHIRGSHWSLGKVVPRGFPRAIETAHRPTIDDKSSGRLQLAEWLTQPDHPLTSRVMANRLWRWHFGRGIVTSVDNFGRLGDKPSHPELLDYLATRFVSSGWSIKSMHRLLLLSSTYQMSSAYDTKAFETDPDNISLWRMPRRRLEAESIRDGIMSASGGIRFDMGGSLLTYKDRQYVANTAKGSNVDYDRPLRAIYVPVLRSSLYDVFSAFDLPDPTMSNGDRDSTVVAPQALFMMNSSVMLKHSRILAEHLLSQPQFDASARVRLAYERALSRPPTSQEIDAALSFIATIRKDWNGDETKAWQSFAKSLLASSEFIYLN